MPYLIQKTPRTQPAGFKVAEIIGKIEGPVNVALKRAPDEVAVEAEKRALGFESGAKSLTWFTSNAAALVPLIAIACAALGFFGRRWITGEHHKEHSDSIREALEIRMMLEAAGMDFDEAVALRDKYRDNRSVTLQVGARAIAARQEEARENRSGKLGVDAEIPYEETTAGMRMKSYEELDRLNGAMRTAVGDLAHVLSETRASALYEAQDAWEDLRDKEADYASLVFEGGTAAPLIAAARRIELTEQRIADLQAYRAEVAILEGR